MDFFIFYDETNRFNGLLNWEELFTLKIYHDRLFVYPFRIYRFFLMSIHPFSMNY
jgi:hypothetical protein